MTNIVTIHHDDWLAFTHEAKERDKTPLTGFQQDPLALSWASYGAFVRNDKHRWVPLHDVKAAPHDIDMAEKTRRYYRDKIAFKSLRGIDMTQFQKDLYRVCMGEELTQGDLGLLYKLPYFYVEDATMGNLKNKFSHTKLDRTLAKRQSYLLAPVEKILHTRKGGEVMNYWWSNKNNEPVVWAAQFSNPLRSLVNGLFERGEAIEINGLYTVKINSQMEISHWYLMEATL